MEIIWATKQQFSSLLKEQTVGNKSHYFKISSACCAEGIIKSYNNAEVLLYFMKILRNSQSTFPIFILV